MADEKSISLALSEMREYLEQEVEPDLDTLERWIDMIGGGE